MRAGSGTSPLAMPRWRPFWLQGSSAGALAAFREGRDIIARLREKSQDDAQLGKDLTDFDAEIAKLESAHAPARAVELVHPAE